MKDIRKFDELIEDKKRRNEGAFFTPTYWVNKAHEYITNTFGVNWRDEYVVYDPAWGTGNLTRDYHFKELYCSTLNQSDIDTANQNGINNSAVKFQYDFLNDPYEKLPLKLREHIENGSKILILMNPPYGAGSSPGIDHKSGIAKTKIHALMKKDGDWGACTAQLFAQFFYRIYKWQGLNKNICIGAYSNSIVLAGVSYKSFRKRFFKEFQYKAGFIFGSSEFSGTKDTWAVLFSLWGAGETADKNNFDAGVLRIGKVKDVRILYNLGCTYSASDWVREDLKGVTLEETIQ